jgi:hypothetical protein
VPVSDRKFSELIHGNIKAMKEQETIRRARGKSVMVIDTEAGVHYLDQSHYDTHDLLVKAFNASYGYGKGWYNKQQMIKRMKLERDLNAASPALAAEQRVAGPKARQFKTAAALMNYSAKQREMLKRHEHVLWGFYHGRGNQ